MPLTVSQLCKMTEPQMIPRAGKKGLENRIKWIVSTEHLEPCTWLRGGEFLLLCGWNFRPSTVQYRRFVDHAFRGNLSGIGFGTGFSFDQIPEPLLKRADELGFPICEVPLDLGFAQISRRATEIVYQDRYANWSASSLLKNGFINDVVDGTVQLEDLAVHISYTLHCNSYFVCGRRGTLARALRNPSEKIMEVDPESRTSRNCAESIILELHRDESSFSDSDRAFLDEMVFASRIILKRSAAIAIERTRLTADLFDEFAQQDLAPEQITRRLAAFGLDTTKDHCAIAIKARTNEAKKTLIKAEAIIDDCPGTALTINRGDCLEALLSPNSDRDRKEVFDEIRLSCHNVDIGIGEIVGGVEIRRSILQARNIVHRQLKGLFGSSETGIEELLSMTDKVVANDFVAGLLPRDMSEDEFYEIETLLDNGFRINEAARALGVHRHTLRAKLDRFTDLTGHDLRNPETRPRVWLALKLARINAGTVD